MLLQFLPTAWTFSLICLVDDTELVLHANKFLRWFITDCSSKEWFARFTGYASVMTNFRRFIAYFAFVFIITNIFDEMPKQIRQAIYIYIHVYVYICLYKHIYICKQYIYIYIQNIYRSPIRARSKSNAQCTACFRLQT